MKNILLIIIIALSTIIFSACTAKDSTNSISQSSSKTGQCQTGKVSLGDYGDKGNRLSNCFVEYPGEPSRQDKSYYIVEDICGQFTKEFISNALGKNIIKIEPATANSVYACSYYTNDKDYVMLVLNYLKIANQKIGQESMGRITVEDPKIPMKNLVVYQKYDLINSLYLVLSDDKFISIQRSSGTTFSSEELINFTANIAQEIKNYK